MRERRSWMLLNLPNMDGRRADLRDRTEAAHHGAEQLTKLRLWPLPATPAPACQPDRSDRPTPQAPHHHHG